MIFFLLQNDNGKPVHNAETLLNFTIRYYWPIYNSPTPLINILFSSVLYFCNALQKPLCIIVIIIID